MMSDVRNVVCDFNNLYKAMTKCRKGVMWKDSVLRYSNNGLINILKLCNSLEDGTYKIDKYYNFTIYEPKKREIVSTKFKDRVFQRSLCDNYLYDAITRDFITDNCACQVGKGTDFARDRLAQHLRKYFKKHGSNGWVLSGDFRDYFGSTPHKTAKKASRKRINNEWVLSHVYDIIDSFNQGDDPEVGMGLGSQVTQLIQLALPSDLDHQIKEKLAVEYFIRYMDDFPLIHRDKEYLKYCLSYIEQDLMPLGVKLNAKKTQIYPLKQGINFLGFKFRLTPTGKVIRLLSKNNIKNQKRKLRKFKKLVDEGKMTRKKVDECYASWKDHASKGNSYKLLQRMDAYYAELWEE